MLRKMISFVFVLCVTSSSLVSMFDSKHESEINKILKEYVEYDKDCSRGKSDLLLKLATTKTSFLLPLIPSLIVTGKFLNYDYDSTRSIDQKMATIMVALSLGALTYSLSYIAQCTLLHIPGVKEWLDPQEADSLKFYKKKREETLDCLKKYISENKISHGQLDQLRHKEYNYNYIDQLEKNILWQLANEVRSCSSHD